MAGAHHHNDPPSSEASTIASLVELRASFPRFRIWREIIPGHTRYIARRLDTGSGLHTIVTDDLTELRETLNAENTNPATVTGMSRARVASTLDLRRR